jgi:hypothetical protein
MSKRGRPALNDDAVLRAVAMRLAKGEASTPRSAIVQALPKQSGSGSSDSAVRRVQRKWHERGEPLLAEARAKLRDQEMERAKLDRLVAMELGGGFPGPVSSTSSLFSAFDRIVADWDRQTAWQRSLQEELQRSALAREAFMLDTAAERLRQ